MKYEDARKLCEAFPILYRNPDELGPGHWCAKQCNYALPFYFECESGWFDLVWEFSAYLEKIAQLIGPTAKQPVAVQVKEKFGGLRYYYHHVPKAYRTVHLLAESIETRSLQTCEFCSRAGQRRKTMWVKTMCDDCFSLWNENDRFEKVYQKYG